MVPLTRELGLADYQSVFDAMREFTDARDEHTPDELWLLQHPQVFTQGQAGRAEHLLAPGDIPVIQVDRGGQVTYHGPGQIALAEGAGVDQDDAAGLEVLVQQTLRGHLKGIRSY